MKRFFLLSMLVLLISSQAGRADDALLQLDNRLVLQGHTGEVYKVAFVPQREHLLVSVGYKDRTMRLWDITQRRQLDSVEFEAASARPRDFVFAPDGKKVSVLLNYGAIQSFPIIDGRFGEAERYWGKSIGHYGQLAISRAGTFFAITSRNNPVTVANIQQYKEYQPFIGTEDYRAVEFANDRIFAAADGNNTLALWDILAQEGFGAKESYEIKDIDQGTGTWALSFSRSGRKLASGHIDGHVTVWQVDGIAAKQVKTMTLPESAFTPVFSPAGNYLAVSCQDGSVYLWETQKLRRVKSYPGQVGSLLTVDINTGGNRIAAGSLQGDIVVWE